MHRLVHARGLVVALALAVLPACAVTTGATQGRLTAQHDVAAQYTVCTSVHASRLRAREASSPACRRYEGVRVIL